MAAAGGLSGGRGGAALRVLTESRIRLPRGPRVIALSGGADSAVCAWAAIEEGSHPVRAVFVNHGLPASDLMAEAARRVARHLRLVLDEVTVEVPAGPSPEGQARRARLAALEEAIKPDEWILTGHTADDRAETVLANLLRGAGAEGLAGIPRSRDRWVRPLLGVPRAEVRRAAEELALPYADDPANASVEPLRNRLRNRLIPTLESEYNPAIREALGRAAEVLAADNAVLEEAAARVPLRIGDGWVKLPAALLASLSVPVAARAVRRALRGVRGPHAGSAEEVGKVLAASRGGPAATLGSGLEVLREGPWVVLAAPVRQPPPAVPVPIPGAVDFWMGHLTVEVAESAPRPRFLGTQTTVLDASAFGTEAQLRSAAQGERVALADGAKKARTAMAEAGVPPRLRARWPVLAVAGKIVWVVGVRPAAWALPGTATERFCVLKARLEER